MKSGQLKELKQRDKLDTWESGSRRSQHCPPTRRIRTPATEAGKCVVVPVAELSRFLAHRAALIACEAELREYKANSVAKAVDIVRDLVAMTTRLFGEDVKVYSSCDPEYPSDDAVVFAVETDMQFDQLMQAESAWARELRRIAPKQTAFRLYVNSR